MKPARENAAEKLNRECDCAVVDLPRLRQRIDDRMDPAQSILDSHPHLFCELPVFLRPSHAAEMQRVIAAIEATVHLPAYREAVLAGAPALARLDAGAAGVFMGFDFHIAPEGPKLIEINSNAGGAFLNIEAHDAHRACCRAADDYMATQASRAGLEAEIMAMFQREWSLVRGNAPLRTIAIVDDKPREQYLYPEFRLAKQLFESHGIRTEIVDVSELEIADGALRSRGQRIDLVYNRLTDFYFESPGSQVLRQAFERDLAVVTPHPRVHALYANKRNLVLLSDPSRLAGLGVDAPVIELLSRTIPPTRDVDGCQERWWNERKEWFFKPRHGFGSRGAYRGDKLTRRVFSEVMNGEYLAQALTPPSERRRSLGGSELTLKVDVRCYVYAGKIQLMAARLYQGQTTNFRTAGGGFAPVYVVGDSVREDATLESCAV